MDLSWILAWLRTKSLTLWDNKKQHPHRNLQISVGVTAVCAAEAFSVCVQFKVMVSGLGCVTIYILAGPNLIKLQVYYHYLNPLWRGKYMDSLWILWLILNEFSYSECVYRDVSHQKTPVYWYSYPFGSVFLKAGIQEQIPLGSGGHEIARSRKGCNFDSYCTQPSKMIHRFLKRLWYLQVFVKRTQS